MENTIIDIGRCYGMEPYALQDFALMNHRGHHEKLSSGEVMFIIANLEGRRDGFLDLRDEEIAALIAIAERADEQRRPLTPDQIQNVVQTLVRRPTSPYLSERRA